MIHCSFFIKLAIIWPLSIGYSLKSVTIRWSEIRWYSLSVNIRSPDIRSHRIFVIITIRFQRISETILRSELRWYSLSVNIRSSDIRYHRISETTILRNHQTSESIRDHSILQNPIHKLSVIRISDADGYHKLRIHGWQILRSLTTLQ